MQWENLTANDFADAVRETGVCILPIGVLERHSDHLPLGTDFLNGHKLSCLAAEREPAVVFPPFYFGQICEARCFPGAVALKPALLVELLYAVLDEIGRNGFKKILIVNAHGGNTHLLNFIAQGMLSEKLPYALYLADGSLDAARARQWDEICDTDVHGHACECETSVSLANHAHLVRMDKVPAAPGLPLNRMKGLPYNGFWWYADHPDHYRGDARAATVEKGLKLRELQVSFIAEALAAIKADTVHAALENEFFRRVDSLLKR